MKIGSLDNKPPIAPVAGERKTNGSAAGAPGASASSATVAISAEASALATVVGDGSFDAAKVDRISRSIQDGSFKPNAGTIADKLIANAQELLTRTYR
jgi:negative regulator of flagellin synthesis FlgM